MTHVKNQKGFTLIELMIVIAIIGILAAVALPQFTGATDKARAAEAKTALSSVATAVETYYAEYGEYPTALENLTSDDADKDGKVGILDSIPANIKTFTPPASGKKGFSITYQKGTEVGYTYTKNETGNVTIDKTSEKKSS